MQNIPIYVVGNKADLCPSVLNSMRSGHHHHHHIHYHHQAHHHATPTQPKASIIAPSLTSHSHPSNQAYHQPQPHKHHLTNHPSISEPDLSPAFKELANLVKKQWKCNYLECSVKYNWRVIPIFKEIMRLIELNQVKFENQHVHQQDEQHRDSIKVSASTSVSTAGWLAGPRPQRLHFDNPLRSFNNSNNTSSCKIS